MRYKCETPDTPASHSGRTLTVELDCGDKKCEVCRFKEVKLIKNGQLNGLICVIFNKMLTANGFSYERLPECQAACEAPAGRLAAIHKRARALRFRDISFNIMDDDWLEVAEQKLDEVEEKQRLDHKVG